MLNLDKNIQIVNSRSALRHNLKLIKEQLPTNCLLSVAVKANAYGHGLIETSQELVKLGVDWLCVTSAEEGVKLRLAGIKLPILIIGPICEADLNQILTYDLKTLIYDLELAKKLNALAKKMAKYPDIHLKIDTGMSRQGINPVSTKTIVSTLSKLSNLNLEGIATHFATADERFNNRKLMTQFEQFMKSAQLAEKIISKKLIKHCANSAATLLYPQTHLDLVRVGIAAYGYYPSIEIKNNWEKKHPALQPVMSVITRVISLKNIAKGTGVSYGLTFKTSRPTKLALLPVGYFDGLSRLLSNGSEVLINNKRRPIIGRVCMDITLVDVTKIPNIKIGAPITIIGSTKSDSISADDLAQRMKTINYEVLTNWKESINRKYK